MHCIIKEVKMSKAKINQLLESRWDEKEANGMSEAQLCYIDQIFLDLINA